jgi:hypothetical protein
MQHVIFMNSSPHCRPLFGGALSPQIVPPPLQPTRQALLANTLPPYIHPTPYPPYTERRKLHRQHRHDDDDRQAGRQAGRQEATGNIQQAKAKQGNAREAGQGPRAKGQGQRAKGKGPRAKGQGPRAKGGKEERTKPHRATAKQHLFSPCFPVRYEQSTACRRT